MNTKIIHICLGNLLYASHKLDRSIFIYVSLNYRVYYIFLIKQPYITYTEESKKFR